MSIVCSQLLNWKCPLVEPLLLFQVPCQAVAHNGNSLLVRAAANPPQSRFGLMFFQVYSLIIMEFPPCSLPTSLQLLHARQFNGV